MIIPNIYRKIKNVPNHQPVYVRISGTTHPSILQAPMIHNHTSAMVPWSCAVFFSLLRAIRNTENWWLSTPGGCTVKYQFQSLKLTWLLVSTHPQKIHYVTFWILRITQKSWFRGLKPPASDLSSIAQQNNPCLLKRINGDFYPKDSFAKPSCQFDIDFPAQWPKLIMTLSCDPSKTG